MFLKNGTTKITVKASKMSPEEFGCLQLVLCLNGGAKAMLTRNLWIKKEFCDGAIALHAGHC